jgi:mono/diheme cytochrome c family protein
MERTLRHALMTVATVMLVTANVIADEAATYFRQNCMSCHTVGGGRLVGPDLKDVDKRADRDWLLKFMVNPKSFLDGNDPYALKLKEESRGAIMPNISGLDPAKAAALLALIEAESKLPKSQFIGLNLTDQPFTSADIENGRRIFDGNKRLANGGAACLSCHAVDDLGNLGGGRLAPDLTKVYERMNGRKNLASWLMAPATPTMRPLFANNAMTNDEIVALVAYLEAAAQKPPARSDTSTLSFFFLGLGGAVFGFIGADTVWRRRFRGVRKPMVRGDR